MSRSAHEILTISVIALALIALVACGSTRTICPVAAGSTCGCGPVCFAPEYLYATGGSLTGANGQVTVFPVETNGALGSPISTTGPALTLGMTALNGQFLYVSTFNLSGQPSTIDAWSINGGTGALTTVQGSPFSLGPFSVAGGMAANASAQVIYVADALKIDALKADSTGALSPIANSSFPGGANLFLTVDPQTRFLFASDYTPPGNVLAFTIDSTGALTAVQGSPFPAVPGSTVNTHPSEIVVDASGKFVYTTLTATGQVAGFSITAATGALTPVPGSPFTTGSTPLALTTVSNFLYVSDAGGVSGYSIDSTTGGLTPLANSPFAIHTGALTTDPFGRALYASGAAGISAYTIDPQTGNLSPIAGSPFPAPPATVLTWVQ